MSDYAISVLINSIYMLRHIVWVLSIFNFKSTKYIYIYQGLNYIVPADSAIKTPYPETQVVKLRFMHV